MKVVAGMRLEDILGHLEHRRPFVSIKVNHGYWERLVAADELRAAGMTDPAELDAKLGQPFLFETDYVTDMRRALSHLSEAKGNVDLSVTPYAWPGCRRIHGMPMKGLAATLAAIRAHVPERHVNDGGLMWKQAVYDGSFASLTERLRGRNVVLIGPSWLKHFGAFAGIAGFRHEAIDAEGARGRRHEFVAELDKRHDPSAHPVYLLQAGSYSPWLGMHLGEFGNASVLDIGLPLTLCHLPKLRNSPWVQFQRRESAATLEAINPHWPQDPRFHATGTPAGDRHDLWRSFRDGVEPRVAVLAGAVERPSIPISLDRPDIDAAGPVGFIENKKIDLRRVEQLLERSREENRWANGGPAAQALEAHLSELMQLHPDKTVIMTSSGTAALFALAGLHSARLGRPLRWLVSAYTFPCQRIGPFHGATIIDCDGAGFLDLKRVRAIDPGEWDGMVVTNLFGRLRNLDAYRELCRSLGKVMLVDGATALFGVDRSSAGYPDEMVSFHQTKPWGVGEGGCAIVDREHAALLRSIISFGIRSPDLWPFAFNGKMPDFAAALILERLERLPDWRFFYRAQQRRIATIAARSGLKPFGGVNLDAIVNSLPFVLGRAAEPDEFRDQRFATHKYYRPIGDGHFQAERIYARMLNVPCHPGMAAVSTAVLEAFFEQLATVR